MKQIWIPKAGAPEVLELREAPDPEPTGNEVRIRVEATGINFADIVGRLGLYQDLPPMPVVVGYEVAGRVDKVGPTGDASLVGKDVFAMTRFGGYSDVVVVAPNQVFLRPTGMSAHDGAALPVNYLTAYQLVVAMGGLRRNETMLVHSAGGGVGIAATQLARHIGATVIGTASTGKHEYLRSIGVAHCIDYTREDFEARVMEITKGAGVELVLDAVGGESYKKSYRVLSATGRLGMFGMSAAVTGEKTDRLAWLKTVANMPWFTFRFDKLINENKGVFGANLGHLWHEVERLRVWMVELVALYELGVVKPVIDRTFKFEEAAAAHHFIQQRKNIGKVLLVP